MSSLVALFSTLGVFYTKKIRNIREPSVGRVIKLRPITMSINNLSCLFVEIKEFKLRILRILI